MLLFPSHHYSCHLKLKIIVVLSPSSDSEHFNNKRSRTFSSQILIYNIFKIMSKKLLLYPCTIPQVYDVYTLSFSNEKVVGRVFSLKKRWVPLLYCYPALLSCHIMSECHPVIFTTHHNEIDMDIGHITIRWPNWSKCTAFILTEHW